jgi:hypothetical protein
MRHYSWIVAVLAATGLAAGCSTTGNNQMDQESPADSRGDIGNGAFGEAVPGAYDETSPSRVTPGTDTVEGHGHTGNGAFGETP